MSAVVAVMVMVVVRLVDPVALLVDNDFRMLMIVIMMVVMVVLVLVLIVMIVMVVVLVLVLIVIVVLLGWRRSSTHSAILASLTLSVLVRMIVPAYSIWLTKNSPKFLI